MYRYFGVSATLSGNSVEKLKFEHGQKMKIQSKEREHAFVCTSGECIDVASGENLKGFYHEVECVADRMESEGDVGFGTHRGGRRTVVLGF